MPRQKATEPLDPELPRLTDKQLAYVVARQQGKNQSDAYREAYDAEGMAPNVIWCKASELESNGKVAVWLNESRRQGRLRADCTLEGHLAELERLKSISVATGNMGAAVQAEKIRGEVSGHRIDRLRVEDSTHEASTLLAQISAQFGPTTARQLARSLGISLEDTPDPH